MPVTRPGTTISQLVSLMILVRSTFNAKKLVYLTEYIVSLRQYTDSRPLKTRLSKELDCSACEWVWSTGLDYIKLFKFNHLPPTHQTEGDMLRRIWLFIGTVFDGSNINCFGYITSLILAILIPNYFIYGYALVGENPSRASSAGHNDSR